MTVYSPVGTPVPREEDRSTRKKLALKLFIELLSYQLASPVRWIETQHVLFQRKASIRRFIEIGPRTTLATIAKKSAAIPTDSHFHSQWSVFSFLSYQDNKGDILYEYAGRQPPTESSLQEPKPVNQCSALSISHKISQKQVLPEASTSARPSADITLSAIHVVIALTAQKLRRPFDQIQTGKTIRELSGGKSTLQNELTGDLVTEFGRVPDGVEDMPLIVVGEALDNDFIRKPAKVMSSLISKLISSKMPAGFNQVAIQEYLKSRWGLIKSHAIIPLCFATSVEPLHRLANSNEAQEYLDALVIRYAKIQGISLIPSQGQGNENSASSSHIVVNSATLQTLNQEQRKLHRAQLEALANYLNLGIHDTNALENLQARICEQEEKLCRWNSEFDDHFFQGIKPLFNQAQVRNYNSWWNWSREDLVRWLNEVFLDPSDAVLLNIEHRLQKIMNRWDPSCTDIILSLFNTSLPEWVLSSHSCPVTKIRPILDEVLRLGTQSQVSDPVFIYINRPIRPMTSVSTTGQLEYHETPRKVHSYPDAVSHCPALPDGAKSAIPFVHIKTRQAGDGWKYDSESTSLFHAMLCIGATAGFNYSNKSVLVTGAGPQSIGAQIVQGLLIGGACVIVTTSRPVSESARFYQKMYREYGAKGSSLTLLPVNQASKQDCESLIKYIYGPESPVRGNLDYLIPFAAIPQAGDPGGLGGRQELALRVMLVNVLRLIGYVCEHKERFRIETRPTMVVLPMSCNEGTFGGDGLYPESKIGLKALFNRFYSESWSTYVTICGAVIGWTRGTSLMRASNMVAEEVEKLGVLTFSQGEMAFNILALMTPPITTLAEDSPIYADLTGGLGHMWNIKENISAARKNVSEKLQSHNAIFEENARHQSVLLGGSQQKQDRPLRGRIRRANLSLRFPPLPELDAGNSILQGMIDLSRVVVVVGYSELGPWGSSRTRWEMENQGKFTLEGYIEMSWVMGLITHANGQFKGQPYVGWVDRETQTPVRDDEVPQKYHDHIMSHAGLRLIESDKQDPYDPSRKEFLHEVAVEEDLPPFESSRSNAEAFKLRHGEHISIQPIPDSDECHIFIKKGAILMVPKIVPFHQTIAGKIPTGWNPLQYGIPEDIVQQVDVTTLYALCCVSEAFLSAGIKDPYELYQYIHASELANCLGTGGGPMKVIQEMYRDRFLDHQIRGDIIVEHFMNTMGAWVNMLLLSATGPLKTPVGACATALESLDIGCEAIQAGKCKVALVGGCDDYREELAYEFANIQATANVAEELNRGRLPSEISRPTTSSRSGFAESAGCGVQLLTSAELAIEMGLPIHGIVAYTQMASDQTGRSIPAPGKGILTAARETPTARNSPFLDINFRRASFDEDVADIHRRFPNNRIAKRKNGTATAPDPISSAMGRDIDLRIHDAQRRWANDIRQSDPSISPIRAALATWGLTVDHIKVVSMHGTSTKANEINEGEVINTQMEHLGRRKGNPLLSVCQKALTGHPKAAAGAWQLNGCLQMLRDCIVPGNGNADNIDEQLRRFEHLVYPMEAMPVPKIDAAMLTSFGFGQKGALSLIVSPKYLFACLSMAVLQEYRAQATKRQRAATPTFISRLMKNSLVQVKSKPPWDKPEAMQSFFLHPNSRVVNGKPSTKEAIETPFCVPGTTNRMLGAHSRCHSINTSVQKMLDTIIHRASSASPASSVGVDIEDVANINIKNRAFVDRNFTSAEQEYCSKAPDPRASFAGRWSAKEAVFKSLQTSSAGAGAAMSEIEIVNVHGIPKVILYGHAQEIAASQGISSIEVTISHSSEMAIAMAMAIKSS